MNTEQYPHFMKLQTTKQEQIIQSGIQEFSHCPYRDANTDNITKQAGISKGLLFHYFGSKKKFYLFCISCALERLIAKTPEPKVQDFYGMIFHTMDEKVRLCHEYPNEMLLINMASREHSMEVMADKTALFQTYLTKTTEESTRLMKQAMETLPLKEPLNAKTIEALQLYTGLITNKYLASYQLEPDAFFKNIEQIKTEIRQYIDIMLYGIVRTS